MSQEYFEAMRNIHTGLYPSGKPMPRCEKCGGSKSPYAGDACHCPPPPIYKDRTS